jgi:hypothetical protein
MKPSKPIWGFGWAGWLLLPVAVWLGWVFYSGYDLRHQILAVITDRFGIQSTYWVVIKVVHQQSMMLELPGLGLWGLTYTLAAFHLQRRRNTWIAVAALVVWAVLRPHVLFLSVVRPGVGPPGWLQGLFTNPEFAVLLCFGAADAALLWGLTRSWAVAAVTAGATVAATVGCGALESLGGPVARICAIAPPYVWHATVGTAALVWAVRARRRMWPEGHCQGCGYDLHGIGNAMCPECGADRGVAEGVHSPA